MKQLTERIGGLLTAGNIPVGTVIDAWTGCGLTGLVVDLPGGDIAVYIPEHSCFALGLAGRVLRGVSEHGSVGRDAMCLAFGLAVLGAHIRQSRGTPPEAPVLAWATSVSERSVPT